MLMMYRGLDKEFFRVPWVEDVKNIDKLHCFYELKPMTHDLPFFY